METLSAEEKQRLRNKSEANPALTVDKLATWVELDMDKIVDKEAIKAFLAPEPKPAPKSVFKSKPASKPKPAPKSASKPRAKSASESASPHEDENSEYEESEHESSVDNSSESSFQDEDDVETSRAAELTKTVPRSRGKRSAATSISASPQPLKKTKELPQRVDGLEAALVSTQAALASTQAELSKTKAELAKSNMVTSKTLKTTTKVLMDKMEEVMEGALLKWTNHNTKEICARVTKLESRMEKLETSVGELKKSQSNTSQISPTAKARASEPKNSKSSRQKPRKSRLIQETQDDEY
ncbi:hypothetical protein PR003_g4679 [Phytophthora rubi]|uniref:Uncharacterized protein n=1 Tax=Phytophthora rubi TaxID=129364 RepID=A0A6A3ML67_9STRA|nr:hypothetical protein PR001_g11013 [Phytophthora rubi]KAE9032161.1 hypothetical protein PR002_g9331 [Phytophthora rubi]KAE9351866.1 hypothetical protein PR003_g4679 [Phytophthora rubi]